MQRIKDPPQEASTPGSFETMAELAEEYSGRHRARNHATGFSGSIHIHIEDTPTLMRRLAAANITTREACGNSVRNVTACPYAGVCPDEVFDAHPLLQGTLEIPPGGIPDCQNFGRKFKPAFSGCAQHACGLTNLP